MRAPTRRTLALAIALGTPAGLMAQPRSVEGRVVVMSRDTLEGVPGTWVTLHRVAADSAGPIDSVRTDARGRYALGYRPFGAPDAIYFASTRYGGVAYFTRPLRAAAVRGEDAELQVFDTTSRAVPKTVRGRHVIVSAASPQGTRDVIEVWEISNDTTVTQLDVERAPNAGTWSAPVPPGAKQFTVREGEVPADALVLANGRAVLRMPFAPGLKQLAYSYVLDGDAFPLTVATESPTSVFEVLVEDTRGGVSGGAIAPTEPVVVEGRSFRRFLGSDLPAASRVVIDAPPVTPPWTRWLLPALIGAIGLAMVGALARPRRGRPAPAPAPVRPAAPRLGTDAEGLARRIAALDDAFAGAGAPSDEARQAYATERAELKARLAAALAGRERPH